MLKSPRAPGQKAAGFNRKARGSYNKSPRAFKRKAAGFLYEGQKFEINDILNMIYRIFELKDLLMQSSAGLHLLSQFLFVHSSNPR